MDFVFFFSSGKATKEISYISKRSKSKNLKRVLIVEKFSLIGEKLSPCVSNNKPAASTVFDTHVMYKCNVSE